MNWENEPSLQKLIQERDPPMKWQPIPDWERLPNKIQREAQIQEHLLKLAIRGRD